MKDFQLATVWLPKTVLFENQRCEAMLVVFGFLTDQMVNTVSIKVGRTILGMLWADKSVQLNVCIYCENHQHQWGVNWMGEKRVQALSVWRSELNVIFELEKIKKEIAKHGKQLELLAWFSVTLYCVSVCLGQ